jgi:hypothetical protein
MPADSCVVTATIIAKIQVATFGLFSPAQFGDQNHPLFEGESIAWRMPSGA